GGLAVPAPLPERVLDPGPLVLVQEIAPSAEVLVPHLGDLNSTRAPQIARRPGFEIQINKDEILTLVHRPDRAQEGPPQSGPQALACKPPLETREPREGGQGSAPSPISRIAERLIPPLRQTPARPSVLSRRRGPSSRLPRGRGSSAGPSRR